jgi:flavin reductase (DIM6/NTAB) family NADH-FMN oxidoreductase RutF
LYSFQDIGIPGVENPTATLVLGLIKRVHIREDVLSEDGTTVDPSKLRPIGRLGGVTYSRLLEGFDISLVSWEGIRKDYERISQDKDT